MTSSPGTVEVSWKLSEQITKKGFAWRVLLGNAGAIFILSIFLKHSTPITVAALGVLALAGALGVIAYAKNVFRVRLSFGEIEVTSRPLGRTRRFSVDDIAGIQVADFVSYGGMEMRSLRWFFELRRERFGVFLMMQGGKRKQLIGCILGREQADEIAQLIRDALVRKAPARLPSPE